MTLIFAAILGLKSRLTNVGAQKVDDFSLKNYGMALRKFLLSNSLNKVQFFEDIFFMADISMKIVLKMLFLFFCSVNSHFSMRELT